MQKNLKNEIYKNGYNIKNFSEISGVSRYTLNDIFKQRYKGVRGDTIYKISKALNMTYEEIAEMLAG